MTIERGPAAAAGVLRVEEVTRVGFTTIRLHAEIATDGVALWTPVAWRLSVRWTTNAPARARPGELDQDCAGRVHNGQLVWSAPSGRIRPAPQRWTDFWCLFAALSPPHEPLPFEFEMCEQLDIWKPAQRLSDAGVHVVRVGGHERRWRVIEQTGRGVTPWRWWLDEGGRVVLAAGDRKAYLRTSVTPVGPAP